MAWKVIPLNCPFCGGQAKERCWGGVDRSRCCDEECPGHHWALTEKWNRRVLDQRIRRELEALLRRGESVVAATDNLMNGAKSLFEYGLWLTKGR